MSLLSRLFTGRRNRTYHAYLAGCAAGRRLSEESTMERDRQSYDRGYLDGVYNGQIDGYNTGYDYGHSDGCQDAYITGFEYGLLDGDVMGFPAGHDIGYTAGHSDGCQDGWHGHIEDPITESAYQRPAYPVDPVDQIKKISG